MTRTAEEVARGHHRTPAQADAAALYAEVVSALSRTPRRLPAKLLYDDRGARLFERITESAAYYPTRTEIEILDRALPEIGGLMGPAARVVEFGTGDGRKTLRLLQALERPEALIPVDISERQLLSFAADLRRTFPSVEVLPVTADYTRPFELPRPSSGAGGGVLVFFPGSTIGNFEPEEARAFLETVRGSVTSPHTETARLLVGVDLVKPTPVLERAYDDPEGVTAEFNRNTLLHLNRLFRGDFAVEDFFHRAVWNEERSRIEMHLLSDDPQRVALRPDLPDAHPFRFELGAGEPIVTEHSYKYRLEEFGALCSNAGWRQSHAWTDPKSWFAVLLLESVGS